VSNEFVATTNYQLPTAKAEDLCVQAIAARPKDQTLYRDLADILLADNKRPKAIEGIADCGFWSW